MCVYGWKFYVQVKPVRDSVGEALQLWKNLPAEPENTSPGGTVANRGTVRGYWA